MRLTLFLPLPGVPPPHLCVVGGHLFGTLLSSALSIWRTLLGLHSKCRYLLSYCMNYVSYFLYFMMLWYLGDLLILERLSLPGLANS